MFGFFESREKKERKTTVMNVIAIMLADGEISDGERECLAQVCERVGMPEAELRELLAHPERIKFTPAKDEEGRLAQLADIVMMMMADGEISESEMDLCIGIAMLLGFPASAVKQMVEHITSERAAANQEVKAELAAFLNDSAAAPSGDPNAKFFLFDGGQQTGPHSYAEVRQKINECVLTANAVYWREGMADWRTVEDLKQEAAAAARPKLRLAKPQ